MTRLVYDRLKTNLFQFHKGTIKTLVKLYERFFLLYFNSIKVQLRHIDSNASTENAELFQFHKGTIKTWSFKRICVFYVISIP